MLPHHPLLACRPSATLAAMNGGVQPSLEQLQPDMFFGADSDDESGQHCWCLKSCH